MTKSKVTTINDTDVRNKAGRVIKRFNLSDTNNEKVFEFRRILSGKWAKDGKSEEPAWEDALEVLLDTHPKLKKIKK